MISLEQVQLLETRVSKAIEYVQRVTAENTTLASEKVLLQKKLETNQKRIDELEVLVVRFKEEQGRIEDGIVAALDRLSQFEEAFENSLKDTTAKKNSAKTREKTQGASAADSSKEIYFNITEKDTPKETELTNDSSNDDLSSEGELDIF